MAGTVEETISTGAYWDPALWQMARAAYVADLDNDPNAPDAFIGWIHRAIEQHAVRGVRGRARLRAEHSPTGEARRGFNRHHPLRASTRFALEHAIIEDRRTGGVVLSRSAFLREAVIVAVNESRLRAGGELTMVAGRLPNHPVRS
jgi:hypothetical protein